MYDQDRWLKEMQLDVVVSPPASGMKFKTIDIVHKLHEATNDDG